MPLLTIEIDEHQEAKIMEAIRDRRSFRLDGGLVDGAALRSITFEFKSPTAEESEPANDWRGMTGFDIEDLCDAED